MSGHSSGASWCRVVLAVGVLTVAGRALAHADGMRGYSGAARMCSQCHRGDDIPMVQVRGPSRIVAGQTGTFTLHISGGAAAVGGLNVAVSSPQVTLESVRVETGVHRGELTHHSPLPFQGAALEIPFRVAVPASMSGRFFLYATGLSADGNDNTQGDAAYAAGFTVHVLQPAPPSVSVTGAPSTGRAAPVIGPALLRTLTRAVTGITLPAELEDELESGSLLLSRLFPSFFAHPTADARRPAESTVTSALPVDVR